MGSFLRPAGAACQFHDPPGTHDDLGCKVIPTIAIRVFFFVRIVHLMAVHKTVTPPLGYKMK